MAVAEVPAAAVGVAVGLRTAAEEEGAVGAVPLAVVGAADRPRVANHSVANHLAAVRAAGPAV